MKSIAAAIALLALTPPAWAGSVTISDQSKTLPGVARTTTAILIGAGIPAWQTAKNRFTVTVKGLHCDRRTNMALDAGDPKAGLENDSCRLNAQNTQDAKTGQPFGEAHAILDLLDRIQQKSEHIQFSDCAMGYCGAFVKTLVCTIRTNVERFDHGGRWECVFTDDQ